MPSVSALVMRNLLKTNWKVIVIAALALPLGVAAKSADSPRLAVNIEAPTVFDFSLERDISDLLLSHMDTAFRRLGFEGRIADANRLKNASESMPVINLRVIEWRSSRTGMVELRFTAELETLGGETENLGLYRGSSLNMGRGSRFMADRAYEDAAVNAMRDLYRDLEKLNTASAESAA